MPPYSFLFLLFTTILIPSSHPLPLSTNNRWIVDSVTGQRVKLACVNWPGATQTMLPEGLDRQPLRSIVASIRGLGFNCVRLTYATYMVTRMGPHVRVGDTFDVLGLGHVKADIMRYNPLVVGMSHLQAFDAVLDELGIQGLMVDLDNHVSKPMWCCAEKDGNGFFGDEYFDPKEWLLGLTTLARRYLYKPQVVGMGLRNELRGHRQDEDTWRKYITLAGKAIHAENPNVLIFAGGISYASVLSFLKKKPLATNFGNKLVYEAHWYPFTAGPEKVWLESPLNELCRAKINGYVNNTAFSFLPRKKQRQDQVPLFIGEVGIPGAVAKKSSDYFLSCFSSWAVENDLDWGWWGLQGDYYFRNNVTGMDEYFGVLSYFWDRPRNPFLINRLRLMQFKNQEPRSRLGKAYLIFHPQTGDCMVNNNMKEIYAAICGRRSSRWLYNGEDSPIMLANSNYCLRAGGDGLRVQLTRECNTPQSKWRRLSASKLHLAARDEESGEYLCLKRDSIFTADIFTAKCVCLDGDEPGCSMGGGLLDPTTQWFKLVQSNVVYI
ncbi:Glycosyl hydrolase 5 family protein [Linum grandiflorum]